MKKISLMLAVALFIINTAASGQDKNQTYKSGMTYLNFCYANSKLKSPAGGSLKSDFGAALNVGHTFYLHKTPVLGLIRFGLDWTILDLNFAKYSPADVYDEEYDEFYEIKMLQAEAGMHIGPSITVIPFKHAALSAYFRYAPSFSGIYNDYTEDFARGFASFFVTGLSVSYSVIAVGVEGRWGSANYKYKDTEYREKLKTSGLRAYLGFRF